MILCLETATDVCSVALSGDHEPLFVKQTVTGRSHASTISVMIKDGLQETRISMDQIDAVAVSKGPGSYTGLRIGVSVAKGIAYATGKPLIAVSTLQAMALGALKSRLFRKIKEQAADCWLCPVIDARRMEVYAGFYDEQNRLKKDIGAVVVDRETWSEIIHERPIVFLGSGSEKCKKVIKHKNGYFIDHFKPSAVHMIPLALSALAGKDFEDTAYFEPYYLKEFMATVPKKNIL